MPETNIFSLSRIDFYPSQLSFDFLSYIQFVVCKSFQFWVGLILCHLVESYLLSAIQSRCEIWNFIGFFFCEKLNLPGFILKATKVIYNIKFPFRQFQFI